MKYNPYIIADRLEKEDILSNDALMAALQRLYGDVIREMRHDEFKQLRKDLFTIFYHKLSEEDANGFEQACEDYVPERDGIENDPSKNFKPKPEFEINQELKAYFEEQ